MQGHATTPGNRAALPLAAACGFPGCEHGATTDTAMCELHRQVTVSNTGSWLEGG